MSKDGKLLLFVVGDEGILYWVDIKDREDLGIVGWVGTRFLRVVFSKIQVCMLFDTVLMEDLGGSEGECCMVSLHSI
jgi:hypothetical protein